MLGVWAGLMGVALAGTPTTGERETGEETGASGGETGASGGESSEQPPDLHPRPEIDPALQSRYRAGIGLGIGGMGMIVVGTVAAVFMPFLELAVALDDLDDQSSEDLARRQRGARWTAGVGLGGGLLMLDTGTLVAGSTLEGLGRSSLLWGGISMGLAGIGSAMWLPIYGDEVTGSERFSRKLLGGLVLGAGIATGKLGWNTIQAFNGRKTKLRMGLAPTFMLGDGEVLAAEASHGELMGIPEGQDTGYTGYSGLQLTGTW